MTIKIVLTKRIEKAISRVNQLDDLSQELQERLSEYSEDVEDRNEDENTEKIRTIEFTVVKEVWQVLRQNNCKSDDNGPIYLHELLEGSDLYAEPPKPPEKNPELIARLKKLRAEQDRKSYNAMVSNLGSKLGSSTMKDLTTEVKSTSKQVSSVINFLCSIIATFVFGVVASQYAFPSIATRVIIGLVLACAVAAAELYFMAKIEI